MASEADIRAHEERRFTAMVGADLAALDQLLDDNMVYTHSAGNVDTKASLVESITTRRQYAGIEPSQQEFRLFGDTAVATGQARIELNGGRILNLRFTDVWVRSGNRWQMVAWQSTPLPAA